MLQLIVNADDFGLTKSCTEAIATSFRKGLITDTTLIANGEDFDDAAKMAREEFKGKVGIHFNLTEGVPLTEAIKSMPTFCNSGRFRGRINRLKYLNKKEKSAVYEELRTQCEKIIGAGIDISHADSHHHIHTAIFIAPIVWRLCNEYGITVVRLHRNIGDISLFKKIVKLLYNSLLRKKFCTTNFMGSAEDIEKTNLKSGIVEVMVHPDFDESGNLIDKRYDESPTLSSIKYWEGAELTSYGELR